jgi:hypothetical protein
MSGRVDAAVESVVSAYLEAVDAEAPGVVEGLYLTGSAALGDFRPHSSDIDFVAVTTTRLDAPAMAALKRAHARLRNRPYFDGLYVKWITSRVTQHLPANCLPAMRVAFTAARAVAIR